MKKNELWWQTFQKEMRRLIANGETNRKAILRGATEAADKTQEEEKSEI